MSVCSFHTYADEQDTVLRVVYKLSADSEMYTLESDPLFTPISANTHNPKIASPPLFRENRR